MTDQPATDKKPAAKCRDGVLTVTVWKNAGDKGAFYSVTPSRSYKKDDAWKETDRFGYDDLLPLAQLLTEARAWIRDAQQAERKAA
jgi:hypothetical protein